MSDNQAAVRRVQIIEAARREFEAKGLWKARLSNIANDVGCDPKLLRHYFPAGKPELFAEVTGSDIPK